MSPVEIPLVLERHNRYIPHSAIAAHSQIFFSIFFPNIREINGTMIIYRDVMNAAFPASVVSIPNCWKRVALLNASAMKNPHFNAFFK